MLNTLDPVGTSQASLPAGAKPADIAAYPAAKPQPFRARAYFRCLALGHDMVTSRSHPGRITCRRCRMRRTY